MTAFVKFEQAIAALGPDQMIITEVDTHQVIATATRPPFGSWTIHADGLDDITVPTNGRDRVDVMKALENHAFEKLGPSNAQGHGYIVCWPVGLDDTP